MHFLRFSFRQAFQGLWRNSVMTFAATFTMVLMLILLSALVIVINGVEAGLEFIESRVEIRAELFPASETQIAEFQLVLEERADVNSVTYVSKEDALARFIADREAQGLTNIADAYVNTNPFPAYYSIELADPRNSQAVVDVLDAQTGLVSLVLGQQTGIERLVDLTAQLRNLGFIVLSFVGLTVLLIVVNSIRMALMARAQEIEIMRLVGASDRYVRWPFILEGVLVGLFGAVITLLLLLASPLLSDIATDIAGSVPLGFDESLTYQITAITVGAGLALGGLGAWISVRTYLR